MHGTQISETQNKCFGGVFSADYAILTATVEQSGKRKKMMITKAHKRQIVATYGYPYFVSNRDGVKVILRIPRFAKKIRRKIGRKIRKLARCK